jgi:cytoskeletal protein CcmA (bactofilin family)
MSLFNKKSFDEKRDEMQMSTTHNHIGKGTEITGDIVAYGIIRIDGKVTGNVKSKSKVMFGKGSSCDGNIEAQNAEIEGEIKGNLDVEDTLVLKPTAIVIGAINAKHLVMEKGAQFHGPCHAGENTSKEIQLGRQQTENRQKAKATA